MKPNKFKLVVTICQVSVKSVFSKIFKPDIVFNKSILLLFPTFGIVFFMSYCSVPKHNYIQPYSKNPRYWQFNKEPLLLIGGSDDSRLFKWNEADLIKQMDLLISAGGNYVRNIMCMRDKGNIWPFARLSNGQFDLDQWNEEYWQRYENFLKIALERDIIVQIELWDPWDYTDYSIPAWTNSCYNPANNINYTFKESGLIPVVDWYAVGPKADDHPFFHTIYADKDMSVVRYYQERFVEKVMEVSLSYPNVLYCISNETGNDIAWSKYWLDFTRKIADRLRKPAYIGEMLIVLSSSVVTEYGFDFADLSQSASMHYREPESHVGEGHFLSIANEIKKLNSNPAPSNSVKQYGGDLVEWTRGDDEGVERFWRSIFAGQAAVRFHRPDTGLGLNERAQSNIKSLRLVTSHFDLKRVKPHQELEDLFIRRDTNEAYIMAEEGKVYALFFTSSGKEVEVDISALNGNALVRWINPNTAEWLDEQLFIGNSIVLTKPEEGQWAVLITSK